MNCDVGLVGFCVLDLGAASQGNEQTLSTTRGGYLREAHIRQRLDEIEHRRRLLPRLLGDIQNRQAKLFSPRDEL